MEKPSEDVRILKVMVRDLQEKMVGLEVKVNDLREKYNHLLKNHEKK